MGAYTKASGDGSMIQKDRILGLDLLRILATYMIVILHLLAFTGLLSASAPLTVRSNLLWFLESACYGAVNCYALISGYIALEARAVDGVLASGDVLYGGGGAYSGAAVSRLSGCAGLARCFYAYFKQAILVFFFLFCIIPFYALSETTDSCAGRSPPAPIGCYVSTVLLPAVPFYVRRCLFRSLRV